MCMNPIPKLVVFPTIVKLTYAEFYLLQNLFPQVIFFAIVQGSMSSLKAYTEEVKVNILTLALIEVEDTLHVLREF